MKVLHMTKVRGIGGAEQHLLALLPALRARGIDAQFLSLDAGGDAERFHRALGERGVPFSRVPCGADMSPALARRVLRATRGYAPDLLHTHMVHADVYGSIAAHLLRVPFVSTRHNDDRYLLGPFRFVDRFFMRGVSRIVAISDAVREFHVEAGLPADKLVTVHYGLDTPPTTPSERSPEDLGVPVDAPLVLAIGRLIAQKDHRTLLEAFARVRSEVPAARLAILGWGPLEAETQEHAAALALGDSILLPGRLEPRAWLERADVFAHTSRWEGFGIVLLEAMLSRLPVVATSVSAVPEIVVDGETGYLVPAGDAKAAADRVLELLGNRDRAETFGLAGLERAKSEFSVERMAERTIAVYEAAVSPA